MISLLFTVKYPHIRKVHLWHCCFKKWLKRLLHFYLFCCCFVLLMGTWVIFWQLHNWSKLKLVKVRLSAHVWTGQGAKHRLQRCKYKYIIQFKWIWTAEALNLAVHSLISVIKTYHNIQTVSLLEQTSSWLFSPELINRLLLLYPDR